MGFKSAKALKITPPERKWLIATLEALQTLPEGKTKTKKVNGWNLAFDMTDILYEKQSLNKGKLCGSAGCIKGWMGCLAAADKQFDKLPPTKDKEWGATGPAPKDVDIIGFGWSESKALKKLFFPQTIWMHTVTPAIACATIHQFLLGKKLTWDGAQDFLN